MAHQPFENWIFSEKPLSTEEKRRLAAHVEECYQCKTLQHAWLSVRQQIATTKSMPPAQGFTTRWRARFNSRLERHQNELSKRWFIGLSGAAVLSIALLLLENLATDAGSLYLGNISYWSTQVSGLFSQIRNVILLLLNNTPTYIWVIAGIVTASWIGIMVLAGSIIILRSRQKGAIHEKVH